MNFCLILILILILAYILQNLQSNKEKFNAGIFDPYSLYLHKEALIKQDWWNKSTTKPFYYHQYYVLPIYK